MEHLMGWIGKSHPYLIEQAFNILPDECKQLTIRGEMPIRTGPRRMMLWEVSRKLLGDDIPQFPQIRGSCVSFGTSHAVEFSQIFDIANGKIEEFKKVYPPYIYGISRVQIGGKQIYWQDGSCGVWAAQGIEQYGVVALDAPGLPQYSGSVELQWGRQGPPSDIIQLGKQHLVRKTARITTWAQAVDSLMNGWAILLSSDVGYDYNPRSDGFMHYSTSWPHCMALIGVDEGDSQVPAHGCILNSWPKGLFGTIKDFRTGETWPDNTIRAKPQDIETALQAGDSYAVSGLDGFNVRTIDESFFNVF